MTDMFPVLRVLGILLMIFSLAMGLPLAVSLWARDGVWHVYPQAMAATLAAGAWLWWRLRLFRQELQPRHGVMLVSLVWFWFGRKQLVEIAVHHRHDRHARAHLGLVGHPPEFLGGDEHLRPRGAQYVAEFLGAVEVHDGHDNRTQQRRRPERRRRLHPVRQLQRNHIAGPHPTGPQTGCQSAREGCSQRPRLSSHERPPSVLLKSGPGSPPA